ncbi:MAG TPA: 6-phosphogluconolactonase [Baekduia sp.]|nr:6-phosphogluconolactonase [Baekduia sp.]
MISPRITICPDREEVARAIAVTLAAAAQDGVRRRGIAHLCLAGGTTPLRAYELLGPLLDDWRGVHLWYGDERCVPYDHADSNHGAARERLNVPGAVFHPMPVDLGPFAGARAYEAEIGESVFDIALCGLGPDGHTASLFPGHPLLRAADHVAGIDDSPKPPPRRITLTLPALNGAHSIVLAVAGDDKAAALRLALGEPDGQTPASLLDRERLEIVCDEDAWNSG